MTQNLFPELDFDINDITAPKKKLKQENIIIVDGTALLFRGYFGVGECFDNEKNPSGAFVGFFSVLFRVIQKLYATHVYIAFDTGKKTFRHELDGNYKVNRPPCPADLIPQFAMIDKGCAELDFVIGRLDGYEADDIMASLAKKILMNPIYSDSKVIIVSNDKDMMQVVSDQLHVYNPNSDHMSTPTTMYEKWGVLPWQFCDYQALVGDASDDIPGVVGIGPKTAVKLLKEHQTLENLYNNVHEITPLRIQEKLILHKEDAFLSKKLATLCDHCALNIEWTTYSHWKDNHSAEKEFIFQEKGFKDLAMQYKNLARNFYKKSKS